MTNTQKQIDGLHTYFITSVVILLMVFFCLVLKFNQLDEQLSHKADRACHNETYGNDSLDCLDECWHTAYYNVSLTCDVSIKYDCQIKKLAIYQAREDYERCVKYSYCFDIKPEEKEVCEIS